MRKKTYKALGFLHTRPGRDSQGYIIPGQLVIEQPITVINGDGLPIMKIPVDATTDLQSAPKSLWFVTGGKLGKSQRAAACHDVAYRMGLVSKKVADDFFYDIMLQDGVSKFRAYIMWKGVDLFGDGSYKGLVQTGGGGVNP